MANKGGYLKINNEVYAQWTDFNLVVGDNVFDIKGVDSIAPTVTNYKQGTVAITAEILKNSVTVDANGEVGVYPKAINKTKFSIYVENPITATVSLQTKVVVGVDVIAPPKNRIEYPTGLCPTIPQFEAIVGFTLLNGVKTDDVIEFDNVGYILPDYAFGDTGNNIAHGFTYFKSKVVAIGIGCFGKNIGTLLINDCLTGGSNSLYRNSGTIEANSLVNFDFESLKNNAGEISIKGATQIGATTGNDSIMTNSTGIFNCNIATQTNDGGNPDGDIVDAISTGATINYF